MVSLILADEKEEPQSFVLLPTKRVKWPKFTQSFTNTFARNPVRAFLLNASNAQDFKLPNLKLFRVLCLFYTTSTMIVFLPLWVPPGCFDWNTFQELVKNFNACSKRIHFWKTSFLEMPFAEVPLLSETQGTSRRKGWMRPCSAGGSQERSPGCHLTPCESPPVLKMASVTQKAPKVGHITRLRSFPWVFDQVLQLHFVLSPSLWRWSLPGAVLAAPALPCEPRHAEQGWWEVYFQSTILTWTDVFCDPTRKLMEMHSEWEDLLQIQNRFYGP